ncbi:MAG: hypothetical protein ACI8UO_004399, partial [Verrucomicrobiales bacterium]
PLSTDFPIPVTKHSDGRGFSFIHSTTMLSAATIFPEEPILGPPYALWCHPRVKLTDDGGIVISDTIGYAVGWGPIGWIAHRIHLDHTVRKIFDFRRKKLEMLFGHEPLN